MQVKIDSSVYFIAEAMEPRRLARMKTTSTGGSAKREHLLDTAQKLFARDGYHAVGIDTVLAEAGVAKMTLYNHFKSKEELIAAMLERRAAEIAAEIIVRVEAADGGARGRVLAVFTWLEDWFRGPGFHGCLFVKAASEYPLADDLPRRAAVAFKSACDRLLSGLCAELGVAEPEALARQLALLVEGATVLAFIHRRADPARDAQAAARALLEAAGARQA
jgi:AcrR family transcriptional regulator